MKRKEQQAKSITQSNDASCHGGQKGAVGKAKMKRQASKKLRQALKKEDDNAK